MDKLQTTKTLDNIIAREISNGFIQGKLRTSIGEIFYQVRKNRHVTMFSDYIVLLHILQMTKKMVPKHCWKRSHVKRLIENQTEIVSESCRKGVYIPSSYEEYL